MTIIALSDYKELDVYVYLVELELEFTSNQIAQVYNTITMNTSKRNRTLPGADLVAALMGNINYATRLRLLDTFDTDEIVDAQLKSIHKLEYVRLVSQEEMDKSVTVSLPGNYTYTGLVKQACLLDYLGNPVMVDDHGLIAFHNKFAPPSIYDDETHVGEALHNTSSKKDHP